MALSSMTSSNPTAAGRYPAGSAAFAHRDLIALAGLAPWELLFLLDEAEQWVELNRMASKRDDRLSGLTIINAFFENNQTLADLGKVGGLPGGDNTLDNNDFIAFIDQFFTGC